MNTPYRDYLESRVTQLRIRQLARALSLFAPYEDTYKEVIKDLRKVVFE